ncbi:MAG: (deoxy)nucleoside triphosphate pyrophosphohydrolase [Bacteroidetes bacterium]|nr:MAG: (deoxy)nucleoside triphosphate pyrophosphohydrolase [Bacteroidota bacterium]
MIQVSCAIIEQEGRVLLAQRSPGMRHPLCWEFPGGKLLPDESPDAAIVREIREELAMEVQPLEQLPAVQHDYGDIHIHLIPIRCRWLGGAPVLAEHLQIRWLEPRQARQLDLAAADQKVLELYLTHI